LDGPAVYNKDKLEWWVNGKRHCTNGAAVERVNGDQEWWYNGVPHRLQGPAIKYSNGYWECWINGHMICCSEFFGK